MSKFKIGDNVRIVSDEYVGTGLLIGTVHPIHSVGRSGYDLLATEGELEGTEYFYFEDELEAVSETPKVGSKFYVYCVTNESPFDTLEEAETHARSAAAEDEGYTFVIFQPLKAFETVTETKEVTLA